MSTATPNPPDGVSPPDPGRGEPAQLVELDRDTCLLLLESRSFGRIVAATPEGTPIIRPLNYRFDRQSQSVIFRTNAGSKLYALLRSRGAALEIDEIDEQSRVGWSVIVSGVVEEIRTPTELSRLEALGVDPWAAGERPHWMSIRAFAVSGRRLVS